MGMCGVWTDPVGEGQTAGGTPSGSNVSHESGRAGWVVLEVKDPSLELSTEPELHLSPFGDKVLLWTRCHKCV